MKKFISIFILFSTLLFAKGQAMVLQTFETNQEINISDIENYISSFKTPIQEEKDDDFEIVLINSDDPSTLKQNTTYQFHWIMIELDENLSSGKYWIEHTNFDFTEHSFAIHQALDRFSLLGQKLFSFYYDKKQDSRRYFVKAIPSKSHVIPQTTCYTPNSFSSWTDHYATTMLLSFFLFGIIFMTAIYNGALYLYNREKSFLYYMLMQCLMVIVLLYQTEIIKIYVMGDVENEEIAIFFYFIIIELVFLFILYFVRSFLETKRYLPFHDKILHYITIVAFIDLFLFFIPIIFILQLYSFILLYVVWLAWLRLKQGYKPALFFMIGWFFLMLGVFLSEFFEEKISFDPLLAGSLIEALFLSLAISYKIHKIKDEQEEQKELLIHQSRLASMGDMLGNIAHQWRQPLSRLGYILMNIEEKDKQQLHETKLEEAADQLEFMSQTIDDFRHFYAPNKEKELFSLANESQSVLDLIAFEQIEITLNIINDTTITNYKNEYKQVLLNLLTNAKDVLLERHIQKAKITIEIDNTNIKVSDNAGGIQQKILTKIFEPYFTTKKKGLGIGLYMSKIIIERNMGGTLEVSHDKDGAIFTIHLPQSSHS